MTEGGGAGSDDDGAERGDDENEVDLGGLGLPGLGDFAQLVDDNRGQVVEPLADRVEHDQAEGNPNAGVNDGEQLAGLGFRRGVTVTCV